MKILILGGTGLISTAITRRLLERGEQVTLFNRGKTESRVPPGAAVITGDRTDYAAFEAAMAEAGTFDCVIDMIGFKAADVESAERAFRGRVGQYIFCSSVCAYGGPAERYPIREEEPRRPMGEYGLNKGKCEDALRRAESAGAFPVTIMRPSQSYGEGGAIVHSLGWGTSYLDRIRKQKPIIVHGDGACLWAACHVDDVAVGFAGAAGNAAAYGKTYNVTSDEWMTWNRYTEGVARALDVPTPELVHIPTDLLAKAAPEQAGISVEIFQYPSIFDNSAAARDLGFKTTISWVDGVRRTVAWLDAQGRIEDSDAEPFYDRLIAAWRMAGAGMVQELER